MKLLVIFTARATDRYDTNALIRVKRKATESVGLYFTGIVTYWDVSITHYFG
jgi:hypothetical protein